jgi:hypothetical protein
MTELPGRRSDQVFLNLSYLVPDGKINHDRLTAFTFQLTAVSRPGRRGQSAAHISLAQRERHTQTRTGAGRLNASVLLQELPTAEALHNESRSNALAVATAKMIAFRITLKTEAACPSEKMVTSYRIIRRHIHTNNNLHAGNLLRALVSSVSIETMLRAGPLDSILGKVSLPSKVRRRSFPVT